LSASWASTEATTDSRAAGAAEARASSRAPGVGLPLSPRQSRQEEIRRREVLMLTRPSGAAGQSPPDKHRIGGNSAAGQRCCAIVVLTGRSNGAAETCLVRRRGSILSVPPKRRLGRLRARARRSGRAGHGRGRAWGRCGLSTFGQGKTTSVRSLLNPSVDSLPRMQLDCSRCGYGVSVRIAPERCPMCGGSAWEASGKRVRVREDVPARPAA
jgi:hypothetical protein